MEKVVGSVRSSSSSAKNSSSFTESDSTDVECFRSDPDDVLHGIEKHYEFLSLSVAASW